MSQQQEIKILSTNSKTGSETIICPTCNSTNCTGGYTICNSSYYFCWDCQCGIFTENNKIINITK